MNEQNSNNMRAGLGVFLLIIWAIVAIACGVYFLNVGGATAWAALPNFVFHSIGWETFRREIVNPAIRK